MSRKSVVTIGMTVSAPYPQCLRHFGTGQVRSESAGRAHNVRVQGIQRMADDRYQPE
jgi:hypothetical protein